MTQQRKVILGLPNTPERGHNPADPSSFDEVRMIEMTHDQFLGLSGRQEDIVVAASVQQDSLRTRILKAVARFSPVDDVDQLIGYLNADRPGPVHHHEVTHLLYGLNKDGNLKFRENKRDARQGTAQLQHIEITDRGFAKAGIPIPGKSQEGKRGARNAGTSRAGHAVGVDLTEARNLPTVAPGGSIMRISPPTATPDRPAAGAATFAANAERVSPTPPQAEAPKPAAHKPRTNEEPSPKRVWPELQALRQRRQEAAAASLRAEAYYDAAAALETVDPEEARRMLAKAEEIAGPGLSPVEAEYLRFADEAEK